jgi:hypothetical protein
METIRITTTIGEDGRVRIDAPSSLPPGPAEGILVLNAIRAPTEHRPSWRRLRGLGKEIWRGLDAQEYVNQMRDEWER